MLDNYVMIVDKIKEEIWSLLGHEYFDDILWAKIS